MAEYRNYKELECHTLKHFDIVYFGTEKYGVRNNFLIHDQGGKENNDKIFIDLWINKHTFCAEHYGYEVFYWTRPSSKDNDYAALTRCVLALYKELDRQVELSKTSKFKIWDEVIISNRWQSYPILNNHLLNYKQHYLPDKAKDNYKWYRVEWKIIRILKSGYLIKSKSLDYNVVIWEDWLQPKDFKQQIASHSNEQYKNTYVLVNNKEEYEKAQAFYLDKFPDREDQLEEYGGINKYMRAWPNDFGAWPMHIITNIYSHYKDITLEVLWEQKQQAYVDKSSPAGDITWITSPSFNPSTKPDMANLEQLKFDNFAKANGKKIIDASETMDEFTEQLENVWAVIQNIYNVSSMVKKDLSNYFNDCNKKQTAESLKRCEHTIKLLSGKEFTEFFKATANIEDLFKTK